MTAPDYYHERVSRPWSREREPRQSPMDSWVEQTDLKVWGSQGCRSSQRRKLHREKTQESAEDSLDYSGGYWSTYACKETTWSWGRNYPKGWEGTALISLYHSFQYRHKTGTSTCSHQQCWKTPQFSRSWVCYSEGSCSVVENNYLLIKHDYGPA